MKGTIDPGTGYVADLKEIGKIINEKVISKMDHKNLNLDCDFMKGIITSTENLAVEIWNQINSAMDSLGCELHCVKITETENQYVEYFG